MSISQHGTHLIQPESVMTRMTSLFFASVGLTLFLFPAVGRSDQSAELQKQLREEAPAAWKKFQQFHAAFGRFGRFRDTP